MAPVPSRLAERYQLPEGKQKGVLVNQTIPNSPAQKAGLKTGDVIHSVDGELVDGPADLLEAIAYKPIGSEVSLEISRPRSGYKGSDLQQVRMKVEERTDGTDVEEAIERIRNRPGRSSAVGADPLAIGGLSLGPASDDGSVPGLRVFTVVPNSEAAMAGFFQGDLLLKVNGQEVNNRADILEALDRADPKEPVVVEFERDGKGRTIRWSLTLPLPTSVATPEPPPAVAPDRRQPDVNFRYDPTNGTSSAGRVKQ